MVIILNDYSSYDLRVKLSDDRDRYIDTFINKASRMIVSNPSYKTDILINDQPRDIVSINTEYPNEKIIHSFDKQNKGFTLGELVLYKNIHWLIIEENPDNDVYLTGKMKQCNYVLKWQNPKTFEIIERWVVVENPYSRGLQENQTIAVGGNQYRIKMQYDDETKLLHLGKRFLIGLANNEPIAYTTVRFDDITNTVEDNSGGFLTIVVVEDRIQENDNIDLKIADYIILPPPPPEPIGSCEITYKGEAIVRAGSYSKAFQAIFKDDQGNLIDEIAPNWEVLPIDLISSNKILIVSSIDNEIQIKANNNAPIGDTLTLKFSANHGIYGYFECEQKIEIAGLI